MARLTDEPPMPEIFSGPVVAGGIKADVLLDETKKDQKPATDEPRRNERDKRTDRQ